MNAPPFRSSVPGPREAIADRALSDYDFRVLLVVIRMVHAQGRGPDCTANPGEIAARAHGSLGATRDALSNLEARGYLPLARGLAVPEPAAEEGGAS